MSKFRKTVLFVALSASVFSVSNAAQLTVLRDSPASLVHPAAKKGPDAQDADAVKKVQDAITAITQSKAKGAQVATFRYRPNEIYQVSVKQGMFTTISIPKNEPIKQFAVSDPTSVDLSVNAEANVGMLRLLNPVTVVATVVTDKHVFYLNISPSTGDWHQGVSWVFDDATGSNSFGYRMDKSASSPDTDPPSFDNGLSGHPNFNYSVEGDALIRPVSVWDNGKFTWVQFPDAIQSLPAVFYVGEDGAEVVNYTVQPGGKQVLINRLMSKFMLRLGNQKVNVVAK